MKLQDHPKIQSAKRVWRDRYSDGNITFDQFLKLSQQPCDYCGLPPSNQENAYKNRKDAAQWSKENGTFTYNGLDRIDNKLLHDLENCVPSCADCNYAKNDRTREQFLVHIARIYKHKSAAIHLRVSELK